MRRKTILLVCMALLVFAGCARNKPHVSLDDTNLVHLGYSITDTLISNLNVPLDTDKPVLVACFVDVNNVERSSSFGRMLPEHIISRFAQRGYTVVEMKLRDSVYIRQKAGEFLLSRKIRDISQSHNAQAVVVGTYMCAPPSLYVSAKIVTGKDARIISSCDFTLPLSENMQAMLW
jgi:TolB-like protein